MNFKFSQWLDNDKAQFFVAQAPGLRVNRGAPALNS
jgi:hypothetical protein